MFDVNSDNVITYKDRPVRHLKDGATSPLKAVWFVSADGTLTGKIRKLPDDVAAEIQQSVEKGEVEFEDNGWLRVASSVTEVEASEEVIELPAVDAERVGERVKTIESDSKRLITRTRVIARLEDMSLAQAYRALLKLTLSALLGLFTKLGTWKVVATLAVIVSAIVSPYVTGQMLPILALMVLVYLVFKVYVRVRIVLRKRM